MDKNEDFLDEYIHGYPKIDEGVVIHLPARYIILFKEMLARIKYLEDIQEKHDERIEKIEECLSSFGSDELK